ncbi:hypothetical protein X748_14340 [Mesorhizobium sp. LNJC386A00]|nr:hypothetical protein X748_14340 [Mesorhizobium sp. LNJC386A00]
MRELAIIWCEDHKTEIAVILALLTALAIWVVL